MRRMRQNKQRRRVGSGVGLGLWAASCVLWACTTTGENVAASGSASGADADVIGGLGDRR